MQIPDIKFENIDAVAYCDTFKYLSNPVRELYVLRGYGKLTKQLLILR
jgi:hypothetical protein